MEAAKIPPLVDLPRLLAGSERVVANEAGSGYPLRPAPGHGPQGLADEGSENFDRDQSISSKRASAWRISWRSAFRCSMASRV